MQHCLVKIAGLFNAQGITWALGASMLLHYKGLVESPGDIDLMVALEDAERADRLLCGIGQKLPPNPSPGYRTRHFWEYRVDGVEVDLMAGFAIRHRNGAYRYRLDPDVLETRQVVGETVYLCPLEDWLVLYLLMGRAARAAQIHADLERHPPSAHRLHWWMEEQIPPEIKSNLEALL